MNTLIFIEVLVLAVLTLFTLAFLISNIWEREKRAACIGGVIFFILMGTEVGLLPLRNGPHIANGE